MWIEIKQRLDGFYDILDMKTGEEFIKYTSNELEKLFHRNLEKDQNGGN